MGTTEFHLQEVMDDFEARVRSHFVSQGYKSDAAPQFSPHIEYNDMWSYNYQNGFTCINMSTLCEGESRDAIYFRTKPPMLLPLDRDEFYVVIGVLHKNTNKAKFTALAAYNQEQKVGLRSIDDVELEGSAQDFFPGKLADY